MKRSLVVALSYVILAIAGGATASADVLFNSGFPLSGAVTPPGIGPQVHGFGGQVVSGPITNAFALNSPKVYLIFVGPEWTHENGVYVANMVTAAQTILSSTYLSGLRQYGSDGRATFGGSTVDTTLDPLTWSHLYVFSDGSTDNTTNPVWFETDAILSNPTFAAWRPPAGGDARQSPIYVVVRYENAGLGIGGWYGGSNDNGPNGYTARAVNVIDVAITSHDQVDEFSWVLSHELAERISQGTGGLYGISPGGTQIADGEPEVAFYAWHLTGAGAPLVTSYWSIKDQAFIVPDGNANRIQLDPVWNGASWTGREISLQSNKLYEYTPPSTTGTLIDNGIASYAIASVGGNGQVFELTTNGQVRKYNGGGSWTVLTGSNTKAYAIVAAENGTFFMLADNGPGKQVWQYTGSGWTPITGTNTAVGDIQSAGDALYMTGNNGDSRYHVWKHVSGSNWTLLTGANTMVAQISAVNGTLYMNARNDGDVQRVWALLNGAWSSLTGSNTTVGGIVTGGKALYMLAANGPVNQVWRLYAPANNWVALTGTNTNIQWFRSTSADPINLYMFAGNDGAAPVMWLFDGNGWVPSP
jgi:hypothetical protein